MNKAFLSRSLYVGRASCTRAFTPEGSAGTLQTTARYPVPGTAPQRPRPARSSRPVGFLGCRCVRVDVPRLRNDRSTCWAANCLSKRNTFFLREEYAFEAKGIVGTFVGSACMEGLGAPCCALR